MPMILSDLERLDAKVELVWMISVITHQPFYLERPDLG